MVIDMDSNKESVRMPVDDVSGFGIGSKVVLSFDDEGGLVRYASLKVVGICDDETDPAIMVIPWVD